MRVNTTVGNVNIRLDTARLDGNLREAQKTLNLAVRKDCEPFVPHLNGGLRGSAWFPDGVYGGVLEYDEPYAHYLYMGELYLAANGSSFARKHEKKYPAWKPLNYHEPGTGKHWFDRAKEAHLSEWVAAVKREAGKG